MDSFRGSFHIASIRKHRTNRSHFHWRWHGIAASRWCVFDVFYCHPPCRSHGSAAPVKKIAVVVFVLGIPCKSWRIMAETLNDSKYTTNQKQWNGLGWIRHCSHESWQSVVFISCSCGWWESNAPHLSCTVTVQLIREHPLVNCKVCVNTGLAPTFAMFRHGGSKALLLGSFHSAIPNKNCLISSWKCSGMAYQLLCWDPRCPGN